MANEKDSKTYWVWAQIEESLHTSLLEVSTTMGRHPRSVIEIAIEEYIVNWVAKKELQDEFVPNSLRLEAIVLRDRARQVQINQVKQLAYNHLANPTDESAEELADACDIAGISVESVLEQMSNRPSPVHMLGENASIQRAASFLVEIMKPGELYPSNDVLSAGKDAGIKEYLLKEAKRKLMVDSRREGMTWYWIMPKKEDRKGDETVF